MVGTVDWVRRGEAVSDTVSCGGNRLLASVPILVHRFLDQLKPGLDAIPIDLFFRLSSCRR